MNTKVIPQLGPATALVQLLSEYPDLPPTAWTIDGSDLRGSLYEPRVQNFEALNLFVEALGGSVRARHDFEYGGQTLRVHELSVRWRDVLVVVKVSIALAAVVPAVAA